MKKRIFAVIACVVVLLSTFMVCVSAADTEYITVRSYNDEIVYLSYDPSIGEKILWDPMELEFLSLEQIYIPDETDTSYLYEFRVRDVPSSGVSFELEVYTSSSGSSLDTVSKVYQFQLYYNESALESGGVPPEGGSTTTPDDGGEVIDGVVHINEKYLVGDLAMIKLYGGEVLKTMYADIPALQKDSQFWYDEDEDGLNDYQCVFFRVTDNFEGTITYDIEVEKYDLDTDTFNVSRVYHFTLLRSTEGENAWREQYNELVEKYTSGGVTDWYAMVSYLLRQNVAAKTEGEQVGYKTGYAKGYKIGYDDGYVKASDAEPISFYGFLKTVMLTPITMVKEITNFDIDMPNGGVFNIWGVISFLITITIVIVVIGFLWSKRK